MGAPAAGGEVSVIAGLLRAATGEDEAWLATLTPATRLDGDLFLDSIELAAFSELVQRRYGVDLPAHLAGLELEQLIALTLADVAELVA